MDALAKAYWRHTELWDRPLHCMPNEWIVSYNGERVVTNFTGRLHRLLATAALEHTWTTPHGTKAKPSPRLFTAAQLSSFDFLVSQKAWSAVPGNTKRFVTKLRSCQLPTGQRMQQYGFWDSSQCPLCLSPQETTDHMYVCLDPRVVACRRQAITTFATAVQTKHTAANIQHTLLALLRHAAHNEPIDLALIERQDLRTLIGTQLSLGPHALLKGQLCIGWREAQDRAYRNYAPWRSGNLWASDVITLLWRLSFTIWELRNTVLHEKQENHPDIDLDSIDLSILEEWSVGADPAWPPSSRTLFASISCDELLAKPLFHRRQWLHYVRLARHTPLVALITQPDQSHPPLPPANPL
jgi:hypothetical protein